MLWSIRGSYQTIWSPPLPFVILKSEGWPYAVIPSIAPTHYTNLWTLLPNWTLMRNLTFYPIARGFHRPIASDVACQRKMLTWGYLVLSNFGTETDLSQTCLVVVGLWVSNTPRCSIFTYFLYLRFLEQHYSGKISLRQNRHVVILQKSQEIQFISYLL